MKNQLLSFLAILSILFLASIDIQAKNQPLFQSDEPLKLRLEVDVKSLMEDKSEEPEYIQGLLVERLSGYNTNAYDVKVKARGGTRRLTGLCDFPPLKLNFKKSTLKNTVFDGQDKLKFVSQCRQVEKYANYVLEEYLLYKTYNIFTDESYKVRLVQLTIVDIKSKVATFEMTGFLIEDDKTLAKRINAKSYDEVIYSQDSCTDSSVDRLAMFQFMIGNTDWYINTNHNIDIFKYKKDGTFIPVPFDFDFAGVINTEYAIPSKQIPITDVRQRYYKGSCRVEGQLQSTINLFLQKKEEIYELYNEFEFLSKQTKRKSLKYFDKFYNILNNTELADVSFNRVCNPEPYEGRMASPTGSR